VVCRDSDGFAAEWVTSDDVDIGVETAEKGEEAGHVIGAKVVESGVIEVRYAVADEELDEVVVRVRVCGTALSPESWRVRNACQVKGIHVSTLPLQHMGNNRGLAVTTDGSLMVVSNCVSHQLSVYRADDGRHVLTFGGLGMGACQFSRPFGLCMTDQDTVLVAELGNHRIQEVTLGGAHVKFLGEGVIETRVWAVAAHGEVVAVGKYGDISGTCVMLFHRTSGTLIREFGEYGKVTGLGFTPDGKHLLVAGTSCALLTTVEGALVRHIGAGVLGHGNKQVGMLRTGDVVVTDQSNHRVCVFSSADGSLLRVWGGKGYDNGQFELPVAFAVLRARLYVLDACSARVQVFE